MTDRNARPVYSTGAGRICAECGWPKRDCTCGRPIEHTDPPRGRIVAKLRMEKKGRGGKMVTVVYDLPHNQTFLRALASELKRACGTGGAVVENTVEIQGDSRSRVRDLLTLKGWSVKG